MLSTSPVYSPKLSSHIHVDTGEVRVVHAPHTLIVRALGSCIAVIAYNAYRHIGGIAHVMLPGKSPELIGRTRYALDAAEDLFEKLKGHGASLRTCIYLLVGAGNVLQKSNDHICDGNIQSVRSVFTSKHLPVYRERLGGYERRCVRLDTQSGIVYLREGGGTEQVFWASFRI